MFVATDIYHRPSYNHLSHSTTQYPQHINGKFLPPPDNDRQFRGGAKLSRVRHGWREGVKSDPLDFYRMGRDASCLSPFFPSSTCCSPHATLHTLFLRHRTILMLHMTTLNQPMDSVRLRSRVACQPCNRRKLRCDVTEKGAPCVSVQISNKLYFPCLALCLSGNSVILDLVPG